jgi:hypothetical protein
VRTTTIAKWKISKVRAAIEVLRKKRYKDSFKSAAVCKTAERKVFAIAHTYVCPVRLLPTVLQQRT